MSSLVAAIAVLVVASMLQSVTGSGFGLVSAPVLLMIDPDLVPGPLLVLTIVAMASVVWRDGRHWDRSTTVLLCVAMLPGVALGVWLTAVADRTVLTVATAALSIGAAVAAFAGASLPQRKLVMVGAGAAGGLMGAVAALPGPPLALVYRPLDARALRATLSTYFLAVSAVSLTMLQATGDVDGSDWGTAAALAPAVLLGGAVGGRVAHRVSVDRARRLTSAVILVAGSVLLMRTLA
ncbi:sulfite exporter TauE/SafE family protein [Rhodococcus gannanensis]|uniref:Probable membrane transporter protein n=1 Tax=Rhodococcus gannanensis TaxID=1960308 RepID=A0ABW4P1Z5_9NOCA